jgi:hypothetical protein
MANPEQVAILKQGVEVWNRWREENPGVKPDLQHANFFEANLRGANLSNVDLYAAILWHANLTEANLHGAHLFGTELYDTTLQGATITFANLREADVRGSDLANADLSNSNLRGASLEEAQLTKTRFREADLSRANLKKTALTRTEFYEANCSHAYFQDALFDSAGFGLTILGDVDFKRATGLESCLHNNRSIIDNQTLLRSGRLPPEFLRGCGLSDWEIENAELYRPGLSNEEITDIQYRVHSLRVSQAIQIKPLFISYSHSDASFVDQVENYLNQTGVRYWRDVHHATAGRLEPQIDQAIRSHPVVLLILSEHSVESDWVQHEAQLARRLEQETKSDVLCPIALDDSWKTCHWPARLREQIMEYNILDFSQWQDPAKFDRMFSRLIEGLGIFYK